MRASRWIGIAALAAMSPSFAACASAEVSTPDVTPVDGGVDTSVVGDAAADSVPGTDAARDDAASDGRNDASSADVLGNDASATDVSATDASTTDAAISDAMTIDSATPDALAADGPPARTTMLLQDSFAAFPNPSLAGPALDALGRPYTTVDSDNFNGAWDPYLTTWDLLIVDTPSESWGFNMVDQRIIAFVNAGGRVVFAHWELWMHPGLENALEVDATPTSTFRSVVRDATAVPDFFALPQSVPSPLDNAAPEASGYPAQRLTLKGAGSLVAKYGATTDAVIAVTKNGRVIVNGFKPFLYRHQDDDGNSKPDMQQLWENEIRYVLSK